MIEQEKIPNKRNGKASILHSRIGKKKQKIGEDEVKAKAKSLKSKPKPTVEKK